MAGKEPVAELQPQFSSSDATLTPWAETSERLDKAEVFWLSMVRPDGRPHVTPVLYRLAGRRAVLLHRAGRTQSEKPHAQPALCPHDRLQRPHLEGYRPGG